MHTPTVIASDLDGTLLNDEHTLSERTRKALIAAREHGMLVVAVTARTTYGVDVLPELHPLVDSIICAGGAIFYQPMDGDKRILEAIDLPLARRAAATITEVLPNAAFAVETGDGIVGERPFEEFVVSTQWEYVDSTDALFARIAKAVKLKVYDSGRTGDEMAAALARTDLGGLDMCHWGDLGMVDFNAPGVNKASGLAAWCAERGVGPEAVIAFGDMPNDVPMLEWAGRSYAMDGGHPEALAAASGLAATNGDDGVAQVIEALLEASRVAR